MTESFELSHKNPNVPPTEAEDMIDKRGLAARKFLALEARYRRVDFQLTDLYTTWHKAIQEIAKLSPEDERWPDINHRINEMAGYISMLESHATKLRKELTDLKRTYEGVDAKVKGHFN